MSTSYQTMLLIGEPADLRTPLADLDADGWLVPAGPQRVALLPREDERGYADVHALAHRIGPRLRGPVLTNEVITSDAIVMAVFEQGRLIHEYVADRSDPAPAVGADAAAFVPFGVGAVDPHRLGAALRGEFEGGDHPPAEFQHWLILKAMNLQPRLLTTAFRWAHDVELPGAIRVQPPQPVPPAVGWTTLELVLLTGLPFEADPMAAGQVVADAVTGAGWRMRAEVGCTIVVPGPAGGRRFMEVLPRLRGSGRIGTYFVKLMVATGPGRPGDDQAVAAATRAWTLALQSRYGLPPDRQPQIVRLKPEEFDIGFRAAAEYASTSASG